MADLPLGTSTWCFNGLAPEIRGVLDGRDPLASANMPAVRAFYAELTQAILSSDIKSVEVWYSQALRSPEVLGELRPLADAGLISSMHAPFGRDLDLSSLSDDVSNAGVEACKIAGELLAEMGGKTLVVHASWRIEDPSEVQERSARSAESIARIADHCLELCIEVAIEVLAGMAIGSKCPELLALLALIDRPNTGICVDVNHVFPTDKLAPCVLMLGPGIKTLHISDYDGVSERHWLPMTGILDWQELIDALRRIEYRGPFMYEVSFDGRDLHDMISAIQANYRKLMSAG